MSYFDSALMKRYREIFNVNLIHHVAGIKMDKVMSGGLKMKRHGFNPTTDIQTKYERAWTHFLSRLLESMWCFGFAAVVSHPDDAIGSVPVVLSLELLRVGMYVDYTGRCQYVFYEETYTNGLFGHPSTAFRSIPGVMVHEYTPPSPHAKINSCISRIMPHFNQMLIATDADLRVITSNSAPSLWTQARDEAKAAGLDLFGRGTSSLRASAVAPQPASMGSAAALAATAAGGSGYIDPEPILPVRIVPASDMDTSAHPRSSRMFGRMPQLDEGARVMKLPDGQEGFAFAAAPEPIFLPHYTELFEKAVADAFKVPVQLFTADKFMRSDRTGHSQQTHMAFVMFEQNARTLQTKMLHVLNDVANAIYSVQFRQDALVLAVDNPEYMEIANSSEQVQWSFRPLVPPLVLQQLYREGTLLYPFYTNFMSTHYNMDPECFAKQPGLTLQELNCIQPAEDISNENDS